MITRIAHTPLIVREYEEAIAFYCGILGFRVVEDTQLPNKRWIRLAPPGGGTEILLSRAVGDAQRSVIGKQSGGRVFLFLHTDDFERDVEHLRAHGVVIDEGPFEHSYGKVVVFRDLYGHRIDLIEPARGCESE